jgi:hypothetical protein
MMWLLIGWFALQGVVAVAIIGRPREPFTPGTAVVSLVLNTGLILATLRLGGAL